MREPSLEPESSASANSAIPAYSVLCPLIFTRRGPPRRSLLFGETYCSAESTTIKSHFCGFIGMKGCVQSNNSIISCQGENVKQKIRFFRAEEQKFAFSVQEPLQSCRKAVLEMTLAKNIPRFCCGKTLFLMTRQRPQTQKAFPLSVCFVQPVC